ncbi:fasciclin domain-containing protein [Nocardiopsis exhalans]|uniref:Fasciclin domain-containing protein n=1 Tax=Nocardiopsis exhalans TaxID=163604 RepID=A0ABY5D6V1_9ACTN|nr:fasciclin domain-containing protein [Nocardiopsis exhalans]USY20069.1 fasciclin domain-containing protein [Nocardiopsis exhalans]
MSRTSLSRRTGGTGPAAATGATAAALLLTLSACGGGNEGAGDDTPRETGQEGAAGNGSSVEPFGPGCSDFPGEGAGSFEEMADQPFATAIADSPVLGNLADALERSGLSDRMDTAEGMTVFAPVDDAFDMYPDGEMDDLLEDPGGLAHLLNYHVVAGEVPSAELDGGVFDALNGGQVRSSASGGRYTVDGYAPVVCADVETANATVHVVGMLLIPS